MMYLYVIGAMLYAFGLGYHVCLSELDDGSTSMVAKWTIIIFWPYFWFCYELFDKDKE